MTADDVIAALTLTPESRVDQRVPKKLLVENGAPTAADKRQINDGIDELVWLAALKPSTIGVPEYRDDTREYLEVAVLSLALRPDAKPTRLVELIHRAIPYPVFLVTTHADEVGISLARKRLAQNEAARVVLDESPISCPLDGKPTAKEWLAGLSLSVQPRSHLLSLYEGWIACVEALQAATITGRLVPSLDTGGQERRRKALGEHSRLTREICVLRAQAEKEKQVNRRVELNLKIKALESDLAQSIANL